MQSRMIAASLGIASVSLMPTLPSELQFCLLIAIVGVSTAVIIVLRASKLRSALQLPIVVLVFFYGVVWGLNYAYRVVDTQLPERWEGVDLWVEGTVVDLPNKNGEGSRARQSFYFSVKGAACAAQPTLASVCFDNLKRVKLNWYGDNPVVPGQHWRLRLRLKRPRGLANPGGFDYQTWLTTKRIDAVGYVRKDRGNGLLDTDSLQRDALRLRLAHAIDMQLDDGFRYRGIIKALILGDRREISVLQWQLLARTGTTHLMVISGLHIGLIAALAFSVARIAVLLINRYRSADRWAAVIAIAVAVLYSAAAGFSLPTQRALIMVTLWMTTVLLRRHIAPTNGLIIALLCCLIADPLAVVSTSFWLSFGAVGFIVFGVVGRKSKPLPAVYETLLVNGRSQFVVFMGLLPILAIVLAQISVLAPIANILLVPVFSLVIVPLNLLALVLMWIESTLGIGVGALTLWRVVDGTIERCFDFLLWIDRYADLVYIVGQPWPIKLLAVLGAAITLLPRGMPLRLSGVILWLPMFLFRPAEILTGDINLTVLDVGQGLAIVVETGDHSLIYDTGPGSGNHFNTASTVLLPFLHHRGIARVDTLVLSHGDSDHVGGSAHVIEQLEIPTVIFGEYKPELPSHSYPCSVGMSWQWEGVRFEFLHPLVPDAPSYFQSGGKISRYPVHRSRKAVKSNNLSCVLKITAGNTQFLLTGDIEREVETALLNNAAIDLSADVLIAPHHGSASSSQWTFIETVGARHVVFSSGYRNAFGHPRGDVLARYQKSGATAHKTAVSGAITFSVVGGKLQTVSRYRDTIRRYWL